MEKSRFIKKPVAAAIVAIVIVIAIFYLNSEKSSSNKGLINNQNVQTTADKGKDEGKLTVEMSQLDKEKASKYPKAPDFAGIEKWINSEPLKIEQLRGKVVLVDFWTYTCINCIRTLPYLKEWDKKYRDKGLVIVGVHSPEFDFEKKYENVLKAVNDYQLKYAVAQDNNFATWSVYQNRYWPHKYLIDIDGYVRYDHIGEGNYDETEKMIQTLLKERMEIINEKNGINLNVSKPKEAVDVDAYGVGTPEIYFGYQFTRGNLGNVQSQKPDEIADYKLPNKAAANYVYLGGKWKNNADNMELMSDEGSIMLIFNAKSVNIVAGSDTSSDAYLNFDSDAENEKNKGSDVLLGQNQSIAKIKEFKLYNLGNAERYGTHIINIDAVGKGFKVYTFTFG